MHLLYTLLLYVLLPFIPLKLLWRGVKQPAYRKHWGERFGRYTQQADKPVIWVHCVSVGETHAAQPLIEKLQTQYPHCQILITHGTPTGREAVEKIFGNRVLNAYLPYDYPFAIKGFLDHYTPKLGILMETELWFNLIDHCDKRDIPLLLLNARLSAKSAEGYTKLGSLMKTTLSKLDLIAAQSIEDEQRFKAFGAENTVVSGNFKFDVAPPAEQIEHGEQLRKLLGSHRPIFVAASTRDGEEEMILDAIKGLKNILTIIVPRHPQRFDEVELLLTSRHVNHKIKSQITDAISPDVEVVLGDTMGELFAYYAASDFAFVGGSLKKFGGQNLIEPATLGKPILMGKYTYNFAEASKSASQLGAASQVKDVPHLRKQIELLATNEALRKKAGEAAITFSKAHTGATTRIMQAIAKYLA